MREEGEAVHEFTHDAEDAPRGIVVNPQRLTQLYILILILAVLPILTHPACPFRARFDARSVSHPALDCLYFGHSPRLEPGDSCFIGARQVGQGPSWSYR